MLRRAVALTAAGCLAAGVLVALGRAGAEPVAGLTDRAGAPLADRARLQLRSAGLEDGRTTLDARIQGAAERALDVGLERARGLRDFAGRKVKASGGSVVVVDLRDDSVVGLASGPELGRVRAAEAGTPGSVMKPLTALAAIDGGLIPADASIGCPPRFRYGDGLFRNWQAVDRGPMTIPAALEDSCNTVFFKLAARDLAASGSTPTLLERGFHALAFGRDTGVLPIEDAGVLPASPTPGAVVAMSVGQGPIRATPLQVARAYTVLAHGRPGSLKSIAGAGTDPVGRAPSDEALQVIRRGLEAVPRDGTAAPAFEGFPFGSVSVAGKTGTAEVTGTQSWSWFVGYAPASHPRYLVVVAVEEGGQGSATAAPIVRDVLDRLRAMHPSRFRPPPPLLPDRVLLGAIALTLLAAAASPAAGVVLGALLGALIDRDAGAQLGPAFLALAAAAFIYGHSRARVAAPPAAALAALVAIGGVLVLGYGLGAVQEIRWDEMATHVFLGSLLAAGAALLVRMTWERVRPKGSP